MTSPLWLSYVRAIKQQNKKVMSHDQNREVKKVTSNKNLRHYTIFLNNGVKYRTGSMQRAEFNECYYNTSGDWVSYIRRSGNAWAL